MNDFLRANQISDQYHDACVEIIHEFVDQMNMNTDGPNVFDLNSMLDGCCFL